MHKDGEHRHDKGNPDGKHNHKKLNGLVLLAAIIAFLVYTTAITAFNTANINNIFNIVGNNTNIGVGEGGSRERLPSVVYYTNTSPIEMFLNGHVVSNNAHFKANITINGTDVWFIDSTTIQADQNFSSGGILIPKGSSYSYHNTTTVHHLEIYEYPILSGKNGTLSINQTVINTIGSPVNAVHGASPLGYANQSGNITIFDNRTTYPNQTLQNAIVSLQSNDTQTKYSVGQFQRDVSLASGTQSVTGIGFKPTKVDFHANIPATIAASWGYDDGIQHTVIIADNPDCTGCFTSTASDSIFVKKTGSDLYQGHITSMDADGFTITWVKTGSPTGTMNIHFEAYR